ncbi:hypothetical protein RIF29_36841 [Crotalaria pallida]|uniref:Uncharacterized protein n=1 Tax=Crotalaria pallida TaxID=3830 RepID=A0AAN9EBK9_CROPI
MGDEHANDGGFPELQIVSIMSVPPLKVTEPRRIRQVLFSDPSSEAKNIHGCYQICLYYEKLSEEEHDDDDKHLAGWIVESLGKALLEHPLLAGRLHRREGDDFEIVSNDSGVRLLEAVYPITLSEFLELNEMENHEAELVFWKEIDNQFPQFSPLFYVQVTNFRRGGYAIGICCSLLLAEVFIADNFLEKWAQIHNKQLLSQNEGNHQVPIFGHLHVKNPDPFPSHMISRTLTTNEVESFVFKITTTTTEDVDFNEGMLKELAMLCVEDSEEKLHRKMGSGFSLLVKESTEEVIKVESCSKEVQGMKLKNQVTCTAWKDFGGYEVAFEEGNMPVRVSWWIGSVADGHVMALPCPKENVSAVIVVSPPLEAQL